MVFGAAQSSSPFPSTMASSSPAFGSSVPVFGSSSTPTTFGSPSSFGGSSLFGQKPAFGGFVSTHTQTSPFGGATQPSQQTFGSSISGSSTPFGTSSQPAFGSIGTPAFGATSIPAFAAMSTPAFGGTSTLTFGSTSSPTFGNTGSVFGVSSAPAFDGGVAFGSISSPTFGNIGSAFGVSSAHAFGGGVAFGASSNPMFGSLSMSAFGSSSTPFGASSNPACGASSTPAFSFGSTQAFGQSNSAVGSKSPIGRTTSPFGVQSSAFGSHTPTSTFGSQRGGSKVARYSSRSVANSGTSGKAAKIESISAMSVYKDKSHEELRWEDYQLGQDKFYVYPVETILDRENFTLEDLLDEDEIIQECKALHSRLINFLSGRAQVEQLIRYIVEEATEDTEKKQTFKFPFIACEIFTCEVDIILKTLAEDEELMNLLFSFLESNHSHSNLLAGYFSKVVVCLLLRKTVPFMQYVQAHQDIVKKLVELIDITPVMEVLIRLIGVDEHVYLNHADAMQWIEDTDVLEMIVDKFISSNSPGVHANAAETLCAITRFAPAGLTAKISSPSFIERLFRHALEDSRPKSVLDNSLSLCISLLDPKRFAFGAYHTYNRQITNGSTVTANPEIVEGMLEGLGDLLKLLDFSSAENPLLTTFGKLQPPLGRHRLKVNRLLDLISVLITVSSEANEKKLIDLGAVKRIIYLFFEYPYNNFLHHHVENIIISCLERNSSSLWEHILRDCDLVGKIIQAEKCVTLDADTNKPTIPAEGKSSPRIGSIGHLTRVSNKLIQLGNSNGVIQEHLQGNSEWTDWYINVLSSRNAVENVYQWACGRPTALQESSKRKVPLSSN
ncbi:uncharacterized protein LOC130725468 [Lotus japonicus]|uniref:uncharacterized protein LOC130725468 n=1 Tax=Lotus japonicus TaxID=34305 RepID=UPI002582E06B|nr:uncharacterized protein LOC130725468 [Lotus japonicus]